MNFIILNDEKLYVFFYKKKIIVNMLNIYKKNKKKPLRYNLNQS